MIDESIIRPASPREGDLLTGIALRSKAYWGYSTEFMDACRAELAVSSEDIENPQRQYFVAELNREVVGYYALERRSTEEYELEALFVEPRSIGRGIGRALIEHAKSRARDAGGRSLIIQGDPNATAFYIAAGGVPIGERRSGSIPGRDLPEFRISLSS